MRSSSEMTYGSDTSGPVLETYYLGSEQIGSIDNTGPLSAWPTKQSARQASDFDHN